MRFLRNFATKQAQLSPTHPFPGIIPLQPFSSKKKPQLQTTTLSNGLKIVTLATERASTSLGLFVNAGTRFETIDNAGVSNFLEHMAFKSTQQRSYQRIVRDVEEMGAQVGATSTREYFVYTVDVMNSELPLALQLLLETGFEPKFLPIEIDEQRKVLIYEKESREKEAQQMVTEMVYEAAFGLTTGLGRSLYIPTKNIESLEIKDLITFFTTHFHPSNMILAGAGVHHEEVVTICNTFFDKQVKNGSEIPKLPQPPITLYYGGERREKADHPMTNIAICFNVGGWKDKDIIPVCVLHMLLGGGRYVFLLFFFKFFLN
jgi:predicted Zn-dependent peptidase